MERPNIIVIMADQMKATASHLYGNTFCTTPSLGKMAEQGVLFQYAFTPHPLCVPARVSLWTSQYPHSHGCRRNETLMPEGYPQAFRIWKEAGFHTGLIGKNHCFECPEELALFDTWCEIGHEGLPAGANTKGMRWVRPIEAINNAHSLRREMPILSPRLICGTSNYPLEDYSTGLIAEQTISFLELHRNDPFALWLSFPDPHNPYTSSTVQPEKSSRF